MPGSLGRAQDHGGAGGFQAARVEYDMLPAGVDGIQELRCTLSWPLPTKRRSVKSEVRLSLSSDSEAAIRRARCRPRTQQRARRWPWLGRQHWKVGLLVYIGIERVDFHWRG